MTNAINWRKALTIAQRSNYELPTPRAIPRSVSAELRRWKAQKPFDKDGFFEQRLRLDDLDEQTLISLMCLSLIEEEDDVKPPALMRRAERLLGSGAPTEKLDAYSDRGLAFLVLVEPLLADATERLQKKLLEIEKKALDRVPFEPKSVAMALQAHLERLLAWRIQRTCILELNVARLEGRLQGESPEERFVSFVKLLSQPAYRTKFFDEYPVLLSQVVQCVEQWLGANVQFVDRFVNDYDLLRSRFHPDKDGPLECLVDLECMVGDMHRGGQSVTVAKFSSGKKLVYKPRPLAVDERFQAIVEWCNCRISDCRLRVLGVLNRGDYGWMEYVEYAECESDAEVKRFYRRHGMLLALLYCLNATDIHFENVIASGECPVVVDIETLFHPICADLSSFHADLPRDLQLPRSIVQTSMVPHKIGKTDEAPGIDISALGGEEGQQLPYSLLEPVNLGADTLAMRSASGYTTGNKHAPRQDKGGKSARYYLDEIDRGFQLMYRLILAEREALLVDDGPIAAFRDVQLRCVLRPTNVYALLLMESFHPDCLRDALRRARHWDKLWLQMQHQPWLARVVQDEIKSLEAGDIPYFYAFFDSKDLVSGNGTVIPDLFHETAEASAKRQIESLSEQDLKVQRWMLSASIIRLIPEPIDARQPRVLKAKPIISNEDFLDEAFQIGEDLMTLGAYSNDRVLWPTPATETDESVSYFAPATFNLYDGQPGIALFLAYLARLSADKGLKKLAYQAVEPFRQLIRAGQMPCSDLGVFSGGLGPIYAFVHLAKLFDDAQLLGEAETLFDRVHDLAAEDKAIDIIGGAAGAILVLEGIYRVRPSELILKIINRCADRIVATGVPQERGVAWTNSSSRKDGPFVGFAHGVAGIGAALTVSGNLLGRARDMDIARAAMEYADSQFLEAYHDWRPMVGSRQDEAPTVNWCQGTCGVGMGLIRMLREAKETSGKEKLTRDLQLAVNATLARGFVYDNHCLCHGLAGKLDFLLSAALEMDDGILRKKVYGLASGWMMEARETGWICGSDTGSLKVPGLMTGLAGIGLSLLRLAEPGTVPSVLLLEGPRS